MTGFIGKDGKIESESHGNLMEKVNRWGYCRYTMIYRATFSGACKPTYINEEAPPCRSLFQLFSVVHTGRTNLNTHPVAHTFGAWKLFGNPSGSHRDYLIMSP